MGRKSKIRRPKPEFRSFETALLHDPLSLKLLRAKPQDNKITDKSCNQIKGFVITLMSCKSTATPLLSAHGSLL